MPKGKGEKKEVKKDDAAKAGDKAAAAPKDGADKAGAAKKDKKKK
jgi:hypothetical protein